jgi:hypothetical protein
MATDKVSQGRIDSNFYPLFAACCRHHCIDPEVMYSKPCHCGNVQHGKEQA